MFGLSSRPEMSISVATSLRGGFFMTLATPVTTFSYILRIALLSRSCAGSYALTFLNRGFTYPRICAFFTASSE